MLLEYSLNQIPSNTKPMKYDRAWSKTLAFSMFSNLSKTGKIWDAIIWLNNVDIPVFDPWSNSTK